MILSNKKQFLDGLACIHVIYSHKMFEFRRKIRTN